MRSTLGRFLVLGLEAGPGGFQKNPFGQAQLQPLQSYLSKCNIRSMQVAKGGTKFKKRYNSGTLLANKSFIMFSIILFYNNLK